MGYCLCGQLKRRLCQVAPIVADLLWTTPVQRFDIVAKTVYSFRDDFVRDQQR